MKIFYILSAYISHRQAGLEYIRCLAGLGHEISCNYPQLLADGDAGNNAGATLLGARSHEFALDKKLAAKAREADLVILHEDPAWHDKIFELLPELQKKRTIICLPWENATLPKEFIRPLRRAAAIWTPSEFCRRAFSSAFDEVHVLPHLVRRPQTDARALAWARDLLAAHGAAKTPVFFSVVDGLNPRKNLEGLLTAFKLFRAASRVPARLLLKQYRAAMPLDGQAGVISLADDLDEAHMAALYAVSTAYVSAHRAEGWGLGLSTAMAFGKIAIATAYSGNLEFMNEANSLLIPYALEKVSMRMKHKIPLFTTDMDWAAPDLGAMAEAMRKVAEARVNPALAANAVQITGRFGSEAIAGRLRELLR